MDGTVIAIAAYDATIQSQREMVRDVRNRPAGVTVEREPVATIHLTVMASGADLDKFMAMLEAITGQQQPDPRNESARPLALGPGTIEGEQDW